MVRSRGSGGLVTIAGRPRTVWLVVVLLAAGAGPSLADRTQEADDSLPDGRMDPTAVWTGERLLVAGGFPSTDEVVAYTPSTGESEVIAHLPLDRWGASSVWTGEHMYLFGGKTGPPFRSDAILRVDPGAGTVTRLDERLPDHVNHSSAVWTGEVAYVLGGEADCCPDNGSIVSFDPSTEQATRLDVRLPYELCCTGAVWTGEVVYLFGGTDGEGQRRDEIVRFDPGAGAARVIDVSFTLPRTFVSAVWEGRAAYVFGGLGDRDYSDAILRYDPGEGLLEEMSADLPTERGRTAAAWTGSTAYVAGGANCCQGEHVFDDILRYDPVPGPPTAVAAIPSGTDGQVTVTWRPPASDTYTPPIEHYLVQRAAPGDTFRDVGTVEEGRVFVDRVSDPGPHRYRVLAVTGEGAGSPSDPAVTPAVPLGLGVPGS